MRIFALSLIFLCSFLQLLGQNSFSLENATYKEINLPEVDNKELKARYNTPSDQPKPFQFAHPFNVDVNLGDFSKIEDANKIIYALKIVSKGAKSLNLAFDKFEIPTGSKLMIYSHFEKAWKGPFIKENKAVIEYWTPVIKGDEITIQLETNTRSISNTQLSISVINHDFIGFGQLSGSCNVDAICGDADGYPEVDNYRDIIRSVGVYTEGGRWACSGALINTSIESCEAYFLTANHCVSSESGANSVVLYWNFENSYCRDPNGNQSGRSGDGLLNQFNSGTSLKSTNSQSDFTLLEVHGDLASGVHAFLAGWNNETKAPASAITIHHPNTDEKRISFEFDDLSYTDYLNDAENPNGSHLRIEDWDIGTTEGGSSGAPLFNDNSLIIGQLGGGWAACGNDLQDWYGAMSSNFTGGSSPSDNISSWLNPNNSTDVQTLGVDFNSCGLGDLVTKIISDTICLDTDTLVFKLYNTGNTNSIIIETDFGSLMVEEYFQSSDTIPPGDSTLLLFTHFETINEGIHPFTIFYVDNTGNRVEHSLSFYRQAMTTSVDLISPIINSEINPSFTLVWSSDPSADNYIVSISTESDMSNATSEITSETQYYYSGLRGNSTYYFQVESINNCGGNHSEIFVFSTKNWICKTAEMNTPTFIPSSATTDIQLNIDAQQGLKYIEISKLDITHTWAKDLSIQLNSPNNLNIGLIDDQCNGTEDLLLGFSDDGIATIDCPATTGLSYKPQAPFSAWTDRTDINSLTLSITDTRFADEGTLNEISILYCLERGSGGFTTLDYSRTVYQTDTLELILEIDTTLLGSNVSLSNNAPASISFENFNPTFDLNPNSFNLLTQGTDVGTYEIMFFAESNLGKDTFILGLEVLPCFDYPNLYPSPDTLSTYYGGFSWEDTGAEEYRLTISSTPDSNNGSIYDSYTGPDTSYTSMVLPPDQVFYWTVTPISGCINPGNNLDSFITDYDYTYHLSDDSFDMCQGDTAYIDIRIGEEYFDSLLLDIVNATNNDFEFIFDSSSLNTTNQVRVAIIPNESQDGNYSFLFAISDRFIYEDVKQIKVNLVLSNSQAELVLPEFNAKDIAQFVEFQWTRSYTQSKLEISESLDFDNLLYSYDVSGLSSFTSPDLYEDETGYFWRIHNESICGTSYSEAFKFTTKSTANIEIDGINITFYPNPTVDLLYVTANRTVGNGTIIIRDLMGRKMIESSFQNTLKQGTIDLSALSAGTYIIEFRLNKSVIYKKINKI